MCRYSDFFYEALADHGLLDAVIRSEAPPKKQKIKRAWVHVFGLMTLPTPQAYSGSLTLSAWQVRR